MIVKFKKLHPDAVNPFKTYARDFCYDVVATSKKDLGDGRVEYGLGFALQFKDVCNEDGVIYSFDFRARSSIHKTGLILSNCIGTGDESYTGEYKAVFYHVIPTLPAYEVGDKILQMHVNITEKLTFELVEELEKTDRGSNGYGSTDKK